MQNIPDIKIFAVYGRVEILDAPNWLEAFREKYNTPYDYHVTLKQPCYFHERQLQDIKNSIRKALVGFDLPDNQLSLHFDSLRADRLDGSIMIMAGANTLLGSIQRSITSQLGQYQSYISAELERYEKNFEPHITIAYNLGSRFSEAVSLVPQDTKFSGIIKEIILSNVSSITPEQTCQDASKTIFCLSTRS